MGLVKDKAVVPKALAFIQKGPQSWFWQAHDEIFPIFNELKKEFAEEFVETFRILDEIWDIYYKDVDKFTKEYLELLPEDQQDVVFSHNDT